nr:HrpT family type III secretion system protein [Pseudomonas deceptionensis]
MSRWITVAITVGTVLMLQGCTTHCRGDSCSRPESGASALVIWWPPQMRVDTGPNAAQPDHLVVLLEH